MNILYLHGLMGRLNEEKRKILEKYGKVFAPDIDYHNDSNSIENLVRRYYDQKEEINVVIGSSMGGFAGWHVSKALQRPALLFNPALAQRSVEQNIPVYEDSSLNFKQLVLGVSDDVVDPSGTMHFLAKELPGAADIKIHLHQHLAHRIPVDVFEEEVEGFFGELCY